jgi:hypothetical protein
MLKDGPTKQIKEDPNVVKNILQCFSIKVKVSSGAHPARDCISISTNLKGETCKLLARINFPVSSFQLPCESNYDAIFKALSAGPTIYPTPFISLLDLVSLADTVSRHHKFNTLTKHHCL